MTLLLALVSCVPTYSPVNTVHGLQVVGIVTNPPQPTTLEHLGLDVWVADGLGLGVDTLVWMCNPVDGRCLEFSSFPGIEGQGLPFDFVAQTGQAEPVFHADTSWPILAGIASSAASGLTEAVGDDFAEGVPGILVWALACVPGVCEVIDQVRARPPVGSVAWEKAAAALSDPAKILEDVEPGEASIAVKYVPFFDPDVVTSYYPFANQAPVVSEIGGNASQRVFSFFDPDGQDVSFQTFTTAGTVTLTGDAGAVGSVTLESTPDLLGRHGDLFLVGEDGYGGTAVWASTAEQRAACEPSVVLPAGPRAGDLFRLADYGVSFSLRMTGFAGLPNVDVAVVDEEEHVLYTCSGGGRYDSCGNYPYGYEDYGGDYGGSGGYPTPFDPCASSDRFVTLWPTGSAPPACALSGRLVELRVRSTDGVREAELAVPVVASAAGFCP